MKYVIDPDAIWATAQDASAQLDELEGVADRTNEAMGDASSALQYSPLSSTAAQRCLEFFVLYEVTYCQERARSNVDSTLSAVQHYVYGDGLMADSSNGASSSIPLIDAPGVNGSGSGIPGPAPDPIGRCTPDNPTGKAPYTKSPADFGMINLSGE